MAGAETTEPVLLERLGLQYFAARSAHRPRPIAADAIHVLNADERAALRRVERGAIARAFAAGCLSALIAAVAEVLATPLRGPVPDASTLQQTLAFWGVVLGVTAVASVFEILFLYWDALRSVHALAQAAGLDLFPEDGAGSDANSVAAALARAALELPNPPRPMLGVNPRREASKLRLLVASLVYKAKVGLTNFVVKALVRRALARAAIRSTVVPFVAVPVTAAWNAVVCWLVLREARIRAMGPTLVHELIEFCFGDVAPSPAGKLAAVRAVASSVVRTEDFHPNLWALLAAVEERVGALPAGASLDDTGEFLRSLPQLDPADQALALRLVALAALVDGRITRKEKALVAAAFAAVGREPPLATIRALRRAFVRGDFFGVDQVRALTGPSLLAQRSDRRPMPR